MRVRDARLSKGQRFGMAVGGLVALAVALPVLDAPPSSIDTTDPKRIGIWSLQLTGHIPFWPDVQATYVVVVTAPGTPSAHAPAVVY